MKKRLLIIIPVFFAGLLGGILAGWLLFRAVPGESIEAPAGGETQEVLAGPEIEVSVGTYIAGKNGENLVVFGGDPICMIKKSKDPEDFPPLQTGDRILVVHDDNVMLSWPAQMYVYQYCLHDDGEKPDISGVLEQLREYGWVE